MTASFFSATQSVTSSPLIAHKGAAVTGMRVPRKVAPKHARCGGDQGLEADRGSGENRGGKAKWHLSGHRPSVTIPEGNAT